ncbi:hypothetical protein [Pseudomonas pseudonitroreducens]|uniref:hypothetical protein n=1 Tax=Pseudomonas pseudonitroreducens TaxID=2892326 RepID=UPI001F1780AC|nr:hypothetical protein [Pseudomonas pseudonitroreducens]
MSIDVLHNSGWEPGHYHYPGELAFVLLVQDERRVQWWTQRLGSVLIAVVEQRERVPLRAHVQSWDTALREDYHEVHVIDAGAMPTAAFQNLRLKNTLLSLHYIGHTGEVRTSSMQWANDDALANFLEKLFANLGGHAIFGMCWEHYLRHHRQPGRRFGCHSHAADWQSLLPALLNFAEQAWHATSATLLLGGDQHCTLGNYVEICSWLEGLLPAQCLITVSVLPSAHGKCSATLLLETYEAKGKSLL